MYRVAICWRWAGCAVLPARTNTLPAGFARWKYSCDTTTLAFSWSYPLCCGLCVVCCSKVAALLMTPVVVISFLLTTNQSCRLVVDSSHRAYCVDLSCLHPFCRARLRGNVAECQLLSLVMAQFSAEINFVQPDTISRSLGACCATSQLPHVAPMEPKKQYNHVRFLWLHPSCLPPIKVDAS